jgi:hypothetical protein
VPAVAAPPAAEEKAALSETSKRMSARPAAEEKAVDPPAEPAPATPEDEAGVPPDAAPVQEDGSTVTLPPPDREVLTQPKTMPVAEPPATTTPATEPPETTTPEDTSDDTLPAPPVGQEVPGSTTPLPKDTLEPVPVEETAAPVAETAAP